MDKKPLADTPLARWLDARMREWEDPETGRIGLSGNHLANLSGISQSLIHEILKVETTRPKIDTLARLAEFFDEQPIRVLRLVLEAEDMEIEPKARVQLLELERIVSSVPPSAQLSFIRSVVSQAEMQQAFAESWAKETIVA